MRASSGLVLACAALTAAWGVTPPPPPPRPVGGGAGPGQAQTLASRPSRASLTVSLLGGGVETAAPQSKPEANDKDTAPLTAAIRHALKTWGAPGVAVAVVRDDRVVYLQGHGLRTAGQKAPVTPDTVFALSSNSKAFTSALIARLADEGALAWDDPVRDHLPWFRLSDPLVEREVTLRDLMCHRTGLAAHELLWRHAPWSTPEAVRRAGRLPLDHPFRARLAYQSTMAGAGGLAAGAAGKSTYGDLLRRKLLTPLGMTATHLTTADAEKSGQLATSHGLNLAGEAVVIPTYRFPDTDPACSAYASARDLARWLRFQLSAGLAADGKRLVSARRLRETHRPHMVSHLSENQLSLWPDTTQHGYALGWATYDHRGHRVVSHGGAIDGFRSHIAMVPNKNLGVAVLTNLDQTPLPVPLANTLLDHLLGLPKRDWHALHRAALKRLAADREDARRQRLARRKLGTSPTRELPAYAGTFAHPAYGTAQVALRQGRLVWRWRNEEAALDHFHYNTFTATADLIGDAEVTFTLNEAGVPDQFTVAGDLNATFTRPPAARKQP